MYSHVLNTANKIPVLGIGTFQIKLETEIENVLDSAFQNGYRLVDTAAVYHNESHIGRCLPQLLEKHGLTRNDVFITTKIGPKDMGKGAVQALDQSLSNLGIPYVDLYLIHWPGKQGLKHDDQQNREFRRQTWLALAEEFRKTSKMRALGVSNFTIKHLEELKTYSDLTPAVLQNEFHPDYSQIDLKEYCEENNIFFQSYSSLGKAKLINDSRFYNVAKKHNKSVSQILLRWCLQQNCGVIPMSKNPLHIAENANIFDFTLDEHDMKEIRGCSKQEKYAWDPKYIF
uniref:Prostaglandin F synthase-like n=1 Tax=Phallusia mammillata TaxID=59560 RepID=A0A6F9DP45_9ASCI|nr:prostaglandin F synthase-like [Phallusia mammillata]